MNLFVPVWIKSGITVRGHYDEMLVFNDEHTALIAAQMIEEKMWNDFVEEEKALFGNDVEVERALGPNRKDLATLNREKPLIKIIPFSEILTKLYQEGKLQNDTTRKHSN